MAHKDEDLVFKVIVDGHGSVEIRDRHDNPVSSFGNVQLAKKYINHYLDKQAEYVKSTPPR